MHNIALLSRKCSINATTKYKYIQNFYSCLDGDLSQIEVNCLAHIIVVMGHRCLFSLEYPNPRFLRTRSITMYIVHQHVLKNRRNRCTTLEKKQFFYTTSFHHSSLALHRCYYSVFSIESESCVSEY